MIARSSQLQADLGSALVDAARTGDEAAFTRLSTITFDPASAID